MPLQLLGQLNGFILLSVKNGIFLSFLNRQVKKRIRLGKNNIKFRLSHRKRIHLFFFLVSHNQKELLAFILSLLLKNLRQLLVTCHQWLMAFYTLNHSVFITFFFFFFFFNFLFVLANGICIRKWTNERTNSKRKQFFRFFTIHSCMCDLISICSVALNSLQQLNEITG